jgi:glycosyltransferase involved in cell wall biosynthesis
VDGVEVHRYSLWRCRGRRWLLKPLSLLPQRRWQCLTLPCNPIALGMWRAVHRCTTPFDVVHATAFPYAWPIVCAQKLAQRLRVPFYLTPFLHLGDPDDPADPSRRAYLSPALRSLLRAADGIFVQTPGERTALLECGIAAEKIILQGLGVAPAECTGGNRSLARQRWNIAKLMPVVGHLANNSAEKGTVDLLQAAAQLWEQGRHFHLVLAGPEMPIFQRFWKTFPHKQQVLRLGPLSDDDKRQFFAGLDLFALPSRSDSFGLVLLEAWANGVPNLAYRAGGIADVVRHEHDGLLVRCGDVTALAAALERLLSDDSLRRRLGENGRERVQTDFRWEDKLAVVRAVYESRTAGAAVHSALIEIAE